jgi:hypothetical protein
MSNVAQFSPVALGVLRATARAGLLAVLVPGFAVAQHCTGNLAEGCTSPGAVCSPVIRGAGPTGHCQTPNALPKGERPCECVGATLIDLTGRWSANDGGVYYVRHIGNEIWWAGMSAESPLGFADLHKGLQFTNVFHGQLSGPVVIGGSGVVLTGDWADVPRGRTLGTGSLTINVSGAQMVVHSATGGFSATTWNRADATPPLPQILVLLEAAGFNLGDIFKVFDLVKKNQNAYNDHSLLDNLKPAKTKPVVVFGNIVADAADPTPMHVNYPPTAGRGYNDFICLNGNDSPPDGDIDFNVAVDRNRLDAQIGFWSQGWETGSGVTATNFRNKLQVNNKLHIEAIMYGGITECGGGIGPTLLPGWQQPGAASVLLNGVPIGGDMQFSTWDSSSSSSPLTKILGRTVNFGDRVRITGTLALDCGHGWTHPCDEDDGSVQNQEIHPVYALDFVQNFRLPRFLATLTGVWSANDAGTYYVRQLGTTVWWLGLSPDESPAYSDQRQTFANVFQGTIQNGQVVGKWADIPLGETANSGPMQLALSAGPESTAMTRVGNAGAFSGASWEKLYDVSTREVVFGLESISAAGPMPDISEPLEVTIGINRTQARLQNAQSVSTSGKHSMRAEIGARIPVTVSGPGPLHISVAFAGHRANWTIPVDDLKPGVYTQTLMPPRVPRTTESERKPGEVTDRDLHPVVPGTKSASTKAAPPLTITYRIEDPGPSK